jgi:hypothetical protein
MHIDCESKGEFKAEDSMTKPPPKDFFPVERLNAFRGGFDRGNDAPKGVRRPQPDYDNTIYSAPNFFEHELIYLENNRVLDWIPRTGEVSTHDFFFNDAHSWDLPLILKRAWGTFDQQTFSRSQYRLYEIVRHPDQLCPAIPEAPITSGVWENRKYHKLLYLGCTGAPPGGRILDYDPDEGTYEIFRLNHKSGPGDEVLMLVISSRCYFASCSQYFHCFESPGSHLQRDSVVKS